jgi:hypothetical protein
MLAFSLRHAGRELDAEDARATAIP